MIEMRVEDLQRDQSRQGVLWLRSVEGSVMVPIEIGQTEYLSICAELAGETTQRPLTHDLLQAVLLYFDAEVEAVQIVDLKNQVFYAELVLSVGETQVRFDARPSDSIAVALKFGAPIYMDAKIVQQVGFKIHRTEQGYELRRLQPPAVGLVKAEDASDIAQVAERPLQGVDSQGRDIDPNELLKVLKDELNKAVEEERYEDAGMIRDEIERIEARSSG